MSKILSQNVENNIKFVIDFFVEPKEYKDWVSKLKNQYLKSVEVPGFRKGMAPEDLVMKQINPAALNDTIFRETLDKFGGEAILKMQEELAKLGRVGLTQTYGINEEKTKEHEDGFLIVMSVELLPEVDLSGVSSLSYEKATEKDLKGRMTLEEYIQKEKTGYIVGHNVFESTDDKSTHGYQVILDMKGTIDEKDDDRLVAKDMVTTIGAGNFLPDFEKGITGVTKGKSKSFDVNFPVDYFEQSLAGVKAVFHIEIKDVKKPLYSTFAEIVANTKEEEHHDHSHPNFKTEDEFDTFVTEYYSSETQKMIADASQRNIIRAAVTQIPDFGLPKDKIDTETDRICGVLSDDSLREKISLAQAFAKTDLPGSDTKIKHDDEVRGLVEDYVSKEFKLAAVWNYIYEMKISEKISQEALDSASNEVTKNPQAYGIHPEAGREEIRDNTFAMLKKQLAANWLFKQVTEAEASPVVKDLESKPKKAVKK